MTCGGIVVILLAEDGVVVLPIVLLAGLRAVFVEEDLEWLAASDGVRRFS